MATASGTTRSATTQDPAVVTGRLAAAAVAAIVLLDAAVVRAPGLALLALPFLIAALRFRRATVPGALAALLISVGYVAIAANFIASNGVHAGWADLLFAYAGTPFAAVLGVVAAGRFSPRERTH